MADRRLILLTALSKTTLIELCRQEYCNADRNSSLAVLSAAIPIICGQRNTKHSVSCLPISIAHALLLPNKVLCDLFTSALIVDWVSLSKAIDELNAITNVVITCIYKVLKSGATWIWIWLSQRKYRRWIFIKRVRLYRSCLCRVLMKTNYTRINLKQWRHPANTNILLLFSTITHFYSPDVPTQLMLKNVVINPRTVRLSCTNKKLH